MTHLNYSLKKLARTFRLQKRIKKTEMDHDELDCNKYKDKKDEWLEYVKQDVLCTAFSYARYCKTMEEVTGFSMKGSLSAPGLGWRYFNSLLTEEDEPFNTNNDIHRRHFVKQSIKGGRVGAFNQYYIVKICGDNIKNIRRTKS